MRLRWLFQQIKDETTNRRMSARLKAVGNVPKNTAVLGAVSDYVTSAPSDFGGKGVPVEECQVGTAQVGKEDAKEQAKTPKNPSSSTKLYILLFQASPTLATDVLPISLEVVTAAEQERKDFNKKLEQPNPKCDPF